MKKLVLTISLLCAFVQYAFAGGLTTYHQARVLFSQGEFLQAKRIFASCLEDPELVAVKNKISNWINDCDLAMQEQNRNAQIAAENRKKKNSERKNNQYVNISVNAKESSELYNSTISVMSEVIRQNERRICPNIDDALTVVTVSLDIKHEEITNGFYKVKGSGTVLLGSAISVNDFAGQWTVDCEATSAVDANDAKRLLLNKLNNKLGYALDNLLNGRPQELGYSIPEQAIAVYINPEEEEKVPFLRSCINNYISKAPGVTLSNVLDETSNKANDYIAKKEGMYVKMESRAPIHEYEGFSQLLRISHETVGGSIVFIGELSERIKGQILTTVTINGADFGIADSTDLTAKNQELAAKLLAVGLDFKEWVIGEDIGGYKLASVNGMHGLILRVEDATFAPKRTIEEVRNRRLIQYGEVLDKGWRFPYTQELLNMFGDKKVLGLTNTYWTADILEKGMYNVVDFNTQENAVKKIKKSKNAAATILVKEF